ncbi:MAG: hypothetical protein ACP5MH_07315 [Thermoproteus sp.]
MPRKSIIASLMENWDPDLAKEILAPDEIAVVESGIQCIKESNAEDWTEFYYNCKDTVNTSVFQYAVGKYLREVKKRGKSKNGGGGGGSGGGDRRVDPRKLVEPEKSALGWMQEYVNKTGGTIDWWWTFANEWARLVLPRILAEMPEDDVKRLPEMDAKEAAKIVAEKLHVILDSGEGLRDIVEELAEAKQEAQSLRSMVEDLEGKLDGCKSVYRALLQKTAEGCSEALKELAEMLQLCAAKLDGRDLSKIVAVSSMLD